MSLIMAHQSRYAVNYYFLTPQVNLKNILKNLLKIDKYVFEVSLLSAGATLPLLLLSQLIDLQALC